MDNQVKIQEIINDFLQKGFGGRYVAEFTPLSETEIKVDIKGEEPSYLIGQHGRTLLSLQHIIRQMYIQESGDFEESLKVIIDVDGYKMKRIEKIKDMARHAAEKAREFGKEIALPTMSAYERHIVHEYIQENFTDIVSGSKGEEPNRRVVLRPGNGTQLDAAKASDILDI